MKLNPDDPRITAYALGELSVQETAQIEKAIAESPEARAEVEQTRALAAALRDEFRAELREAKPRNIMPLSSQGSFWSDARWSSLAIAASLAILGIVGAVLLFENRTISSRVADMLRAKHVRLPADVQIEVENSDEEGIFLTNDQVPRDAAGENTFVSARTNPVLTFQINFGTAAYSAVRRALENGSLPPKDVIRVEEMVNYFSYDYPTPSGNDPFFVDLAAVECPWQPEHRLLRIVVRGREANENSARIENTSVEFNPARVSSYHLIGYDSAAPPRNEAKGEFSTGVSTKPTATILFEVVPAVSQSNTAEFEMARVTLRHQTTATSSREEITAAVKDNAMAFKTASLDFRFAAAVAEFGLLLRKSPTENGATFADVLEWASAARGVDADGARAQFIELVRRAQSLTSG